LKALMLVERSNREASEQQNIFISRNVLCQDPIFLPELYPVGRKTSSLDYFSKVIM